MFVRFVVSLLVEFCGMMCSQFSVVMLLFVCWVDVSVDMFVMIFVIISFFMKFFFYFVWVLCFCVWCCCVFIYMWLLYECVDCEVWVVCIGYVEEFEYVVGEYEFVGCWF